MGSIWKTILSFAVIIMITAIGIAITTVNVDMVTAADYLEGVAVVVRECHYNEEVIRQCEAEAGRKGYILEVTIYQDAEQVGEQYAKLSLKYPYSLPIFQMKQWKVKEKII